MKVAITGKGGVGKTTITAVLARTLARSHDDVVAVDADPNPNLAIALGIGVEQAASLPSAANFLIDEKAHSHEGGNSEGHGEAHGHDDPLATTAEGLLELLGVPAPDGVRLIQTGRIERPTDGCLCCGSHRTSRRLFDELDGVDRMVVADLEAGVADLMWVWPKADDIVLVVTEPYQKSLEVGRRALQVATEMEVGRVLVVANRVEGPDDADYVRSVFPGREVIMILDDPVVAEASRRGLSVMDTAPDSAAVAAIAGLAARIGEEAAASTAAGRTG